MNQLEIYGTLGPSCCTEEILQKMLQSGMTGIRLNLSHCNLWDKKEWLDSFHQACTSLQCHAELMIDMRGPELRIKDIQPIQLNHSTVELDDTVLPVEILNNVEMNDILLIDDGKIRLRVMKFTSSSILCEVIHSGIIHSRKSVLIEGKTISGPVLTESDIRNIQEANQFKVTAIMQPFVSRKEDLFQVKETLKRYHAEHLKIYAKIENKAGLEHLEELMPYCDCIVIARGDLGNAVGLIELPKVQKQIEHLCHLHHQPYMVVTEMLNSMIEHPTPTRAEVSDVFHAVYEGASAIMLTGETASGRYPVEAMHIFKQVADQALEYKGERK